MSSRLHFATVLIRWVKTEASEKEPFSQADFQDQQNKFFHRSYGLLLHRRYDQQQLELYGGFEMRGFSYQITCFS